MLCTLHESNLAHISLSIHWIYHLIKVNVLACFAVICSPSVQYWMSMFSKNAIHELVPYWKHSGLNTLFRAMDNITMLFDIEINGSPYNFVWEWSPRPPPPWSYKLWEKASFIDRMRFEIASLPQFFFQFFCAIPILLRSMRMRKSEKKTWLIDW